MKDVHESLAPNLFVDTDVFDWIVAMSWHGTVRGLLPHASALGTFRTHFRKFVIVDSTEGTRWHSHYYDPRLLEIFLPTCREELTEFFGPVRWFGLVTVS